MTSQLNTMNTNQRFSLHVTNQVVCRRSLFDSAIFVVFFLSATIAFSFCLTANARAQTHRSTTAQLKPGETIHELIEQLQSRTYAGREAAMEKLIAAGGATLRPLTRNLFKSPPEVDYRTRRIIKAIATRGDEATFLKAAGILKLVTFGTLEGNPSFATDLERQWEEQRTERAARLLREAGATVELQPADEPILNVYSIPENAIAPEPVVTVAPKRLAPEQRINIVDRILVGSIDNNRSLVFGAAERPEALPDLAELRRLQQRQLWNNQRNIVLLGQDQPSWGNSVRFDKNWTGNVETFGQIVALENLNAVSLKDLELTTEMISVISRVPELQQLTLDNCNVASDDFVQVAGLTQLTQLDLLNLKCPASFFNSIQNLTNIQTIKIENCKVEENDLVKLANVDSLQQVLFKDQSVSGACLNSLGNLKGLRFLELNKCEFDVEAVKSVRKRRTRLLSENYPVLTIKPIARAFMGVRGPNPLGGNEPMECMISEVVADSGAERAGLQMNDVITQLDGKEVNSFDDLILHISQLDIGDKPVVRVRRNGKEIDLPTELTIPSFVQ